MNLTMTGLRNEVAAHTIPFLPESAQAKIVGDATTWKPKDLRQVAKAPDTDIRLLIGPTNYSGQGYLWARAAETLPGVGARNLQYYKPDRWNRFPADTDVRVNVWGHSHLWKRRQAKELAKFTHVIIEAGRPLIVDQDWTLTRRHVEELQEQGIKVALLWHGTDIRLPSMHMRLEPSSPYFSSDQDWVDNLEATAQANHDLGETLGVPEFVSNPYLRSFRPRATWLPTLSDPDRWDAPLPRDDGHTPVVLHVPSQRVWKGTDLIRPILHRLEDEGTIKYVDVTVVPPHEMPTLVASADIIVDGIVNGQYGVASIEAMLSRRVTVAHTWDETRRRIYADTGMQVPVVEATPGSFEQVIRGLAAAPARRLELGEAGRKYAQKVHGSAAAAQALAGFLFD